MRYLSLALVKVVVSFAFVAVAAIPAQATTIYQISLDGPTIDFSGYIETAAIGTFNPLAFDSLVVDFSLTASTNGSNVATYNSANSSWGFSAAFPSASWGGNISIVINGATLRILAPTGAVDTSTNLFVIRDALTGGNLANLRLGDVAGNSTFGYLGNSGGTVHDALSSRELTFVAAAPTAVPEPATLLLLSAGLGGIVRIRRRLQR